MSSNAIKMSQLAGKSSFTINRNCTRSQLLVTLKRNEQKWLSPIGWVGAEKSTLLDCSSLGELTQIDIPEEFARDMEDGDVLSFSSYELEIEDQRLIWSLQSKASKGLFGRLRSKTVEEQTPALNKFEVQAAAAQKAAEEMRAKMETAQKAKEAAHQRALEAARLAEEACVFEETRIAEMQAATQQLEEAEELRRLELERIKEEHRLEQERRLEEARLAEEARQREIARRRKEELMAKRNELSSQLVQISDKRGHEEKYVHSLKGDIEDLNSKAEKNSIATSRIETKLGKMQGVLAKQVQKLSTANDETVSLESDKRAASQEVERASSAEQYLLSDLHKAQIANDKAEQAVQEAIAQAKLTKARAEKAQEDSKAGTNKLASLQGRMTKIESALKAANDRHQVVKTHFEAAKLDTATAKANFDAAKAEEIELQAEHKAHQSKLAAATARLEIIHTQEHVTKSAIELIDNDADLDVVQDLLANTPAKMIKEAKRAAAQAERPSFLGNFKRKPTKTEIIPEPKTVPKVMPKTEIVVKAAALAAAPAATLKIAEDAKAPEEIIEIPADKNGIKTVPARANGETMSKDANNQESNTEDGKAGGRLYVSAAAISVLMIGGFALAKNIPVSATPQQEQIASFKTNMLASTASTESVTKTAAVDIPAAISPAIEIPSLEIVEPNDTFANTSAKLSNIVNQEKVTTKTVAPVKMASLEKITPKTAKNIAVIPPTQVSTHSLQTKIDMQANLSNLGFYSGEISGVVGPKTKAAIIEFKQLFGMPSNADISNTFLAELQMSVDSSKRNAEQDRLTAIYEEERALKASAQPQAAMPVANTQTITTGAENNLKEAADPIVQAVQASGIMTQTASLSTVKAKTTSPIEKIAKPTLAPVPDKIVQAKRINAISASYPEKALRRGFDETIQVNLQYDLSVDGTPLNPRVSGMTDVPERYKIAFEKEGLKAVGKMRFSPKTVNGIPTFSKDNNTRIIFQVR